MSDGASGQENFGVSIGSPMGRRILAFDWAVTSAGPISTWPEEVLTLLRVANRSSSAMTLLLGPEGLVVPNDAAIAYLGSGYESSVGQPLQQVFPNGKRVGPVLEACFQGRSVKLPDTPIEITRGAEKIEGWFSLSFTPILTLDGKVVGVFLVFMETTDRVLGFEALRLARQRTDLALEAGGIVATWDFDANRRMIYLDGSVLSTFGIPENEARIGVSLDRIALLLHPDDRDFVLSRLDLAVAARSDFLQRFRAVRPDGSVRTMSALGRSRPASEKEGTQLAGVLLDVSHEDEAAAALEQSNLRFDILAESVPEIVWSSDAAGRRDYYNRRWSEFTGIPLSQVTDDTVRALVHPEDWPRAKALWDECIRTGAPYNIVYRYLRRDGQYRWLKVTSSPLRAADGKILRWYGTATDIDREKMLEVQRALVAKELDHRIKNLFAVANSLVAVSVRETPALRDAAQNISARFRALYEAHRLVFNSADGQSTSLRAMIAKLLAPYTEGDSAQVELSGDDPAIAAHALTPLALVLHELATNAAKYGAIRHNGQLRIIVDAKDAEFVLVWDETSTAIVEVVKSAEGFGSRLMDSIINVQLKGSLRWEAKADGVRIRIELPLAAVNDPQ